ncbi:uncharacterized protein C6orf118-like [Brachionichthys hirsutus]|uniref:uncharacterized protein C6orf118-like n=1 Tax=Brachionichthys hirsutus TaxID=412623 RepID=UPI003605112D
MFSLCDVRRLLQAAEARQKADILVCSSGPSGPCSLKQSQPHRDKNMSFWMKSHGHAKASKPPTVQQTWRMKMPSNVKQKEINSRSPTAPTEPNVRRSRQDPGQSSQRKKVLSLPKIVCCSSNSSLVRLKVLSEKQPGSSSDTEGKQRFSLSQPEQGLNNKRKLEMKKGFGRDVTFKQELWAGRNVAEMHERKLQKELKKLTMQTWPHRDRLEVFSDVFDDVCEGSTVFGRILREIKMEYDLYVNHMMSSQSSLLDISPNTPLRDPAAIRGREQELEEAQKEVCMLEEEARRALEENNRVRNELQNVPAVTGPEDSDLKRRAICVWTDASVVPDATSSVRSKRLQVVKTWREIQQLEGEIEEKLVSADTIAATQRRVKDVKRDIMRLIASNDCLKTNNKDVEQSINTVLDAEKASKATRQTMWDEIHADLHIESERLQA